MDKLTQSTGEFSTTAEWDMKSILLNQYAIAYNCLAEYILEPNKTQNEMDARKSILKLAYPLFPKLYVLGVSGNHNKMRDYIAYFMRYPDKMKLMECQASFLILQRCMEKLGITKFEQYKPQLTQVYDEE